MTPLRVSIFAAIASLILLAVIFELIRSRRLQERYALLWLLTGGVILILSVWRDALRLSRTGRHRVSTVGALRAGLPVHPRGAPALLDGHLRARGAERLLAQDIALLEERLRIQERATERGARRACLD